MITPFHARSDFPDVLTVEHKIQIFYERVTGWQLDIADKVINGIKDNNGKVVAEIKDAGFAALNIVLNYFEMISKYKNGYVHDEKTSTDCFIEGFKMVFPEFDDLPWLPAKVYTNARCGLYHHGMTEEGIILKGGDLPPITPLNGKQLIINPHTLVLKLKDHFEKYITELRNDKDFQSKFEKRFNKDNTLPTP
jgi:hypothetical protein